jgi:hypothetical protein
MQQQVLWKLLAHLLSQYLLSKIFVCNKLLNLLYCPVKVYQTLVVLEQTVSFWVTLIQQLTTYIWALSSKSSVSEPEIGYLIALLVIYVVLLRTGQAGKLNSVSVNK